MASNSASMPPRKKQVAEQQRTEEQPAPITRLLGCDDVLGKVYGFCTKATKRALRASCSACYRSPAINAFLRSFTIRPHTSPEGAASALAAFPRLAQMRGLTIQRNDVKRIFMHLLGPAPEAISACAKLQHVETIKFRDCQLDAMDAAATIILFPVIRSDHGRIQVEGKWSARSEFFSILAAQSHITELEMDPCSEATLKNLASFGSLKSLALTGGVQDQGPFSLVPLCSSIPSGPQLQLTKLELKDMNDMTGLDVCLAHHPLRELQLIGVSFPTSMAPSMQLASPTLKVMGIRLHLTFPVVSIANFPCLHTLHIESIDLGQIPGVHTEESIENAEESIQHCARLASSIAEFPCVQCKHGGSNDSLNEPFCVWGSAWSPDHFFGLIQKLAPLQPSSRSIRLLEFSDFHFCCGAMRAIAALFPNVVRLEVGTSEVPSNHYSYNDEYGLSEAVLLLPGLKKLAVTCESPPKDVIRALAKATQGLVLQLIATNESCRQLLEGVKVQWEALRVDQQDGGRLVVESL